MREYTTIYNHHIKIPVLLWGKPGDKIILAVHGDLSHKEDTIIELLAKKAVPKGYTVLSFDLPEHGDRKDDCYMLNPPNAISDLQAVYTYARTIGKEITLFACSIGAYFSLLAYPERTFTKILLLSPLVNMERIIQSMMNAFQVSEQKLEAEQSIPLPIGKTLDWNYYMYAKQHPIKLNHTPSLHILYGSEDTLTPPTEIKTFAQKYQAKLTITQKGKHYLHTTEQLQTFENWLGKIIN